MTFAPFIAAPTVVQVHALAAFAALGIGAVQLLRKRRDTPHRIFGYIWVTAMGLAAILSFWIHGVRGPNAFSPIHLLSILTLVSIPLAILAVRRRNVLRHRRAMTMLFWFGLVLPGVLTLLPGRIMNAVAFGP